MPRLFTRHRIVAAAALLVGAAGSAFAQRTHVAPADRNAALAYSTLFYTDMPKELTEAIDAVDFSVVGVQTDPAKLPEAYKSAAEQTRQRQGGIRRLMEATRLAKCDFEIAYESGFNALLSHLGLLRRSARMLRFDARRMLIEGQPDDAAERIASLYRLAGHLKSDEVLISSLVSIAIAGLGNSESEVLANSGKLTATGREAIVSAIEGLGRMDPFGVKSAVEGERLITVMWVRTKFPGPRAGDAFVKAVTKEWGLVERSREELNEIAKMDDREFSTGLDRLDEYHRVMQSQWDLPDAAERLEVLASRIGSGEFGPFTKFLAPSFSKARQGQSKAELELAAAARRLRDYSPPAAPGANPK